MLLVGPAVLILAKTLGHTAGYLGELDVLDLLVVFLDSQHLRSHLDHVLHELLSAPRERAGRTGTEDLLVGAVPSGREQLVFEERSDSTQGLENDRLDRLLLD